MSAVPVGKGLSGSSTARIAGPSGPGWGWEGPAPTAMSRSLSLTCSPRKCCPAPWASPGPFPPGAPGPHSARSLRAPALPRHATMHHNVPRRTRSRSPGHLRSRAPNDTFDWLVNRKDRPNREGSTSNQLWEAASSSPKPATTCSNNASANRRLPGLLLGSLRAIRRIRLASVTLNCPKNATSEQPYNSLCNNPGGVVARF